MIFSEMDHRLSIIKRWNIVHTHQEQSVAEHVCNVTRIADRIAFSWFGITDAWMLLEINRWAQHHDDIEAVMGDAPSMVKDCIDEEKIRERYKDLIPMMDPPVSKTTKDVVKMADMLDAIIFLRIELALGNSSVREMAMHHENRMHQHLANRPQMMKKYQQFMFDMFGDGFMCKHHDRRGLDGTEASPAGSIKEVG